VRIIVQKAGYVVVNEVQLQLAIPGDADAAPLIVILAKDGDREEMARRFYRLKSFDVIEETYQKKVKELEDAHQADSSSLEKLRQERDQANAAAEKAAEELAKNQPGQGSELYQNAMRLFLAGKIQAAIDLLD
jgi:TolA-binding protein